MRPRWSCLTLYPERQDALPWRHVSEDVTSRRHFYTQPLGLVGRGRCTCTSDTASFINQIKAVRRDLVGRGYEMKKVRVWDHIRHELTLVAVPWIRLIAGFTRCLCSGWLVLSHLHASSREHGGCCYFAVLK